MGNQSKKDSSSNSNNKTTQKDTQKDKASGIDVGVPKRLGPWEITVTKAKVVTDSDVTPGEGNEILIVRYSVTNVSSDAVESDWEAGYESDRIYAFASDSGMAAPTPAQEIAPGQTWDATVYYATPIDDRERTLIVGVSGEVVRFKLR